MESSNFILWSVLTVLLAGLLTILLTYLYVFTRRKGEPWILRSSTFIRCSGLAGILGGLLYILFAYFYVFTHGTSQVPRRATLFGLTNLQYYRLSIIGQLLILFGLVGLYARYGGRAGRLGRGGSVIALLGMTMLVVSTVLQVYIVDPDQYFYSFPVQSGWMLQLLSYPVYAVGMVLLGIASLRSKRLRWLSALLVINGLLPFLSLVLPAYVTELSNNELMRDILYGTISVPYGLSWVLLGYLIARAKEAAG